MKLAWFAPVVVMLALHAPAAFETAELKPHTLEAFLRYVRLTEAQILEQVRSDEFLRIDQPQSGLEDVRRAREDIAAGEVHVSKLRTLDDGEPIEVKNGLIHHWYGGVFVEGVTLDDVLALVKDYDAHDRVFAPDVQQSEIEDGIPDGDVFDIRYRFLKKKVITAVVDTWHHVEYTELPPDRAYSMSRTTRVQEVENAGEANETLKAPDTGRGFVWRINSYWRFMQREDGVFIECESISLTRDIPLLLRPVIGPLVGGMPRETLELTLGNARDELERRAATASGQGALQR